MSQVLTALTDDTILQSGENVAVQFSATMWTTGFIVPTPANVVSYCSSDSRFSPSSFSESVSEGLNPVGWGGTIYFTITDAGQGMTVADMKVSVNNQLNYFKSVLSVSIDEVDTVTQSLAPSIPTTITIAAIAIILVVLAMLYFSLKTKRAVGI